MTRRLKTLTAMLAGAAALIVPIVLEITPVYVWNASESVPIGLYRLQPADNLFVTELVAVQPPEPLATFLDLNGYLPAGVPMLKRVLALPGQTVCRSGLTTFCRRDRNGRGPRSRWPRSAAAEMAGLPRRRRGRTLRHELAVHQLAGWPLFRVLAGIGRHWPCAPCVDLGGLIVRVLGIRSAIPLFGRVRHHSSVPTNNRAAVARSGGPGRPKGRREAALPWTGASTAACLCLFERSLHVVVPLFLALTVSSATAVAGMRPAGATASYRTNDPFAAFVEEASRRFGVPVHWIRAVIKRRKRRRRARQVTERRHGADADHAGDLGGSAPAVRSRQRSVRSPRQHSCGYCVSSRTARPVWFTGLPCSLQRGTCSLRRASRRPSIAS